MLTDSQTRSGKTELTIHPTGGDREVHHSPGFKGHAPALQAGRRKRPGPQRGRAETKERRRDSAAPNVIMQWTGLADGGGAGCFVF